MNLSQKSPYSSYKEKHPNLKKGKKVEKNKQKKQEIRKYKIMMERNTNVSIVTININGLKAQLTDKSCQVEFV